MHTQQAVALMEERERKSGSGVAFLQGTRESHKKQPRLLVHLVLGPERGLQRRRAQERK